MWNARCVWEVQYSARHPATRAPKAFRGVGGEEALSLHANHALDHRLEVRMLFEEERPSLNSLRGKVALALHAKSHTVPHVL